MWFIEHVVLVLPVVTIVGVMPDTSVRRTRGGRSWTDALFVVRGRQRGRRCFATRIASGRVVSSVARGARGATGAYVGTDVLVGEASEINIRNVNTYGIGVDICAYVRV